MKLDQDVVKFLEGEKKAYTDLASKEKCVDVAHGMMVSALTISILLNQYKEKCLFHGR